jgi:hypothetical protein
MLAWGTENIMFVYEAEAIQTERRNTYEHATFFRNREQLALQVKGRWFFCSVLFSTIADMRNFVVCEFLSIKVRFSS